LEQCFESLFLLRPKTLLVRVEGTPETRPSAGSVTQAPSAQPALAFIPVPRVRVKDGTFSIQGAKSARTLLEGLGFKAENHGGTAWSLSLTARSPETTAPGSLHFVGSFRPDAYKLAGKMILEKWPLASAGTVLKDLSGWQVESGTVDA